MTPTQRSLALLRQEGYVVQNTKEMNLMEIEEWRPVIGFEGAYEVSNLGRVRSHDHIIEHRNRWGIMKRLVKGRIMNERKCKWYPRVHLKFGDKSRKCDVHVLVAESFIGPRPTGMHIDHIDGVKQNNHASNLEYVTPKENTRRAVKLGLHPIGDRNGSRIHFANRPRGDTHSCSKLTSNDVRRIREMRSRGVMLKDIAAEFGITLTNVSMIALRQTWRDVS